jgi:hypothetical protein
MSALAIGIALALAASLALNTSYLLQHAGSAGAPAITPLRPIATLRSLLCSRAWFAGGALGMLGWAMHVGALSRAPLSVVQAFVAGGLALAVPIGRFLFRHVLERPERVGIALMALALAGLAAGIRDVGAHGAFDSAGLALYLAGSGAGAVAVVALPSRRRRPQALGLAGGLLYGAADVAIKALTGVASRHSVWQALASPWLAAAALATVGAFFCFQRGLQSGPALPVIALMTAGTNSLSIAAGFVVFGDPLGRTPALTALHAASFVVVVAAGSLLAPRQARLSPARAAAPQPSAPCPPASGPACRAARPA